LKNPGHRPGTLLGWTRGARNGPACLNDVAPTSLGHTGGSTDRVAVGVAAASDRTVGAGSSDASRPSVVTDTGPGWWWTVGQKPAAQLARAAIRSLVARARPAGASRVGSPIATNGSGSAFTIAKAALIALGTNSASTTDASRSRRRDAAIRGSQEAGVLRLRPACESVQWRASATTGSAQDVQYQEERSLCTEATHGNGFGHILALHYLRAGGHELLGMYPQV
jgi:hypothetical protein